jgi:hypothetical protein
MTIAARPKTAAARAARRRAEVRQRYIDSGTPGPNDLLAQMGPSLYRAAYGEGMSLSAYLEQIDPSDRYQDGLDAFSRLCKAAGIITRSIPELGIWADELEAFEQDDQTRALLPELWCRMWRRAQTGRDVATSRAYTSTDDLSGGVANPFASAMASRDQPRISPPIRLADITAIMTAIEGDTFKAYYLTDSEAQTTMARVPELSEIPMARLTGGDRTIKLYKYGRGLEASYEALRRMRIDKVALYIARLAIRNEMHKVSQAIKVLVSGDGNSGTAATNWRAKTDLDSAATGKTITLKAWLAYKLKFFPAYSLTHVLASEGDVLKLLLLPIGSSTAMPLVTMPTAQLGNLTPMSDAFAGSVQYGVTTDVPADKLVGFDASAALEHVTEIGANIEEVERFVTRQSQAVVLTEVEGFAVFDPNATKTLELET